MVRICFSFQSLSMLCYIRLLNIPVQLFAFNVTLNQGKNNDIVFLLHSTSRFNSRLELALNDNHIKSLLKIRNIQNIILTHLLFKLLEVLFQ